MKSELHHQPHASQVSTSLANGLRGEVADKKQWELRSGKDVADALHWLRQRTEGKALLLVAIGRNGISFAKHPDLDPADAVQILEDELFNLKRAMERMKAEGNQRGSCARKEY